MMVSFFIISSTILLIGSVNEVFEEIIFKSVSSGAVILSNGNSLISRSVNRGSLSLSFSFPSPSSVSSNPTAGRSFIDIASLGGAFGVLSNSEGGINVASLPLKDLSEV